MILGFRAFRSISMHVTRAFRRLRRQRADWLSNNLKLYSLIKDSCGWDALHITISHDTVLVLKGLLGTNAVHPSSCPGQPRGGLSKSAQVPKWDSKYRYNFDIWNINENGPSGQVRSVVSLNRPCVGHQPLFVFSFLISAPWFSMEIKFLGHLIQTIPLFTNSW